MTTNSKLEAKLNALADYLGVEFAVRDKQAMCVKDEAYRGKLSKTDVEKIVETLWNDKRFRTEFEKHLELLEQYLQMKIVKRIGFAVEDQAKLYAISEIMKANYYDKLKKMEEE